jgi:sulfite exporter TauE/SafE
MHIEFVTLFLIGFLGGFSHCIGMCGGIVLTYTLKIEENDPLIKPSRWQLIKPHFLYNMGRIITYTFLGEIFGLIGGTLGIIFAIRDFQGGLQLIAGFIMLLMGIELAGLIPSLSPDTFPGINKFKQLITSLFNRVNRKNIFGLGLVLGFLPCGLVYAVGAKAAATQSFVGGMLTMLVFGLGTFPAMLITGMSAHFISNKFRRRLYRVAAIMVMILAVFTILRGIDSLGWIRFYWLF